MKLVPVSELFDVHYGTSLELNALEERSEGIPFVSRTGQNNGVSAYVAPVSGVAPLQPGVLSVALGGSPLSTFLQEQPFYSGRDVATVRPKAPMSRDVMLYYATCLQANRYRFSYGRQANRSLAGMLVPALTEIPTWAIAAARTPGTMLHRLAQEGGGLPSPTKRSLPTLGWRPFSIESLFEVESGKPLTKDAMVPGQTPFIGATEQNNGVTAYIESPALQTAGTISVSFDGSIGQAFYQPMPYWPSEKVRVLKPRSPITRDAAIFLATLIRLEQFRYNYGRKWKLDTMKATKLNLPVTAEGRPDWNAMEAVVRGCPSYALLTTLFEPQ